VRPDLQTSGAPTLVRGYRAEKTAIPRTIKTPRRAPKGQRMMAMAHRRRTSGLRVLSIDSRGIDMPLHTPAVVPLQVGKPLVAIAAPRRSLFVAMISIMRRTLSLTRRSV